MAWRLAYSLEQLRTEVNARWPNRSKASDGTIGDPSHAATASDHNPNPADVVCALDITHDPANGPDIEMLGRALVANPHRDMKYIIFNRKIASRNYQWAIRVYKGDPHTNHVHVSVGTGPDGQSRQPYDDRIPWLTATPTPAPAPEEPDLTAEEHVQLNNIRADVITLHQKMDQMFTKVDALTAKVDALPDT